MEPLDGAADPNAWHIAADHGPLPNPVGHTFPILTHDADGQWRLIGTGFYISQDGLFVTARHVIDDVLDGDQQVLPVAIMQFTSESGLFGAQNFLMRPIMQCWLGETADIALGVAATATNKVTGKVLTHWNWRTSWTTPQVGATVSTLAFPNHIFTQSEHGQTLHSRPDAYIGQIQDVKEYRDRLLVPYPYIQVDTRIHGGASGGPVFGPEGSVIGVNCRYFEPDGPGICAQIRCLQNAYFDDGMLKDDSKPRRIEFHELVSTGVVEAKSFSRDSVPTQAGVVVRLDRVQITAPRPQLELTQYF